MTTELIGRDWDRDLAELLDSEAFQAIVDQLDAVAEPTPGPATAHPLVTKTTAELVAEALTAATPTPIEAAPAVRSPLRGIWRILPTRMLTVRRPRGPVDYRPVTVAEFLELTEAVLRHSGWSHTGSRTRSRLGRRCIRGAQGAVYLLGYGDARTAEASSLFLDEVLLGRGAHAGYQHWNEQATEEQALALVAEARHRAEAAGR